MKKLWMLALLPLAVSAEIKDRIAAVVNGHPITLSEAEERVAPELARVPPGPSGVAQRKDLIKRSVQELIDESLVESEATALGIDVSDDELQKLIEQLAKQNNLDMPRFREALAQQGLSFESVKDQLRRQQLMIRLLQYKVKPRKVSDEEVQAAYANMNRDAEFEVRARDIYIAAPDGATPAQQRAAEARADAALRRIKEGDSFARVARDVSDGPTAKEGGDLGYFRRGQMLEALEDPAFKLKPGEVSGLIHVPGEHGGYHMVMVEDRRRVPPKPLSEVQEEIRQRLAGESVLKEREHYLSQLRKTAQVDEKP
ncbi:MAG TPA: peptidylprolyl isomerase [Myxococcales bacterium]|nr:peptidylprolyl isomerase [Myxococcales bacterium]